MNNKKIIICTFALVIVLIVAVVVSLFDTKKDAQMIADFEKYKAMKD